MFAIEAAMPTEETFDGDWEKTLVEQFKERKDYDAYETSESESEVDEPETDATGADSSYEDFSWKFNVGLIIVTKITDVYNQLRAERNSYAAFIFKYHQSCAKLLPVKTPDRCDKNDFNQIFNFYVHCVFDFLQENEIENNRQSTEKTYINFASRIDETGRGLLAFGGGTIMVKYGKLTKEEDTISLIHN
ncbi:unnamed protein product [Mytilus coruscus]|uniref:Uncharacterized protein n=1 Tax=Mytilus coruscus TaxID=42192 RepID=A0A6J8CCT8_MYTCO|nr:unnamed protein product [Mytilus coruscus]